MTRFLTLIIFSLTLPAMAGEGLAPLFAHYETMQSALAADDFAKAKKAVTHLHEAVSNMEEGHLDDALKLAWKQHKGSLATATEKGKSTSDIAALRTQFEGISNGVIALAETAKPEGLHRFRCPMAFSDRAADWLQKGTTTANPYHGSGMLRCGYQIKPE